MVNFDYLLFLEICTFYQLMVIMTLGTFSCWHLLLDHYSDLQYLFYVSKSYSCRFFFFIHLQAHLLSFCYFISYSFCFCYVFSSFNLSNIFHFYRVCFEFLSIPALPSDYMTNIYIPIPVQLLVYRALQYILIFSTVEHGFCFFCTLLLTVHAFFQCVELIKLLLKYVDVVLNSRSFCSVVLRNATKCFDL